MTVTEAVLSIRGLRVLFDERRRQTVAVDRLDLDLYRGEVLAIVGESGSGKSATAHALLGLNRQAGVLMEGEARFAGKNLLRLSEAELRQVRGRHIGMIFQNALTALNPLQRVGAQIAEMIEIHFPERDGNAEAVHLLHQVGLAQPERYAHCYPHQLSGGMRQRAVLAMAIACGPEILIADEPTTALDASVQKQVLGLLLRLCREQSMAVLLITHDLDVAAAIADRVVVMYAGGIVESAPVDAAFHQPQHPYLWGLRQALPRSGLTGGRLRTIPGTPPRGRENKQGCAFAPRCTFAHAQCSQTPLLIERLQHTAESRDRHLDACWLTPAEKSYLVSLAEEGSR